MLRCLSFVTLIGLCLSAWSVPMPEDGTPVRGLWWDPGDPGHGIDLHRQPGTQRYTMIWYSYDPDGLGTWYVGSGELDGNELPMELLEFRWDGTQGVAESIGEVNWTFADHQSAWMDWRIDSRAGRISLVPFAFATGVSLLPRSGLWSDPQEPGWGLSLASQGDTQVAIAYYYDGAGRPRWAIGSGSAAMDVIELTNFTGPCPGCNAVEGSSSLAGRARLTSGTTAIELELDIEGGQGLWQRSTRLTRLTDPLYLTETPRMTAADEPLAFIARVLPMDQDVALEDHVVVTRDGSIQVVSPRLETDLAQGTQLIVAPASTLLPGLADAHVHVPTALADRDLFVFLAYGVTSVRVMWGNSILLRQRDRLAAGDILAPRLHSASPGIESPAFWPGTIQATTASAARSAVNDLVTQGYDFIKIYNNQTPTVYAAIVDQAARLGVDPIGHVPFDVDLGTALDGPQRSIEHLRGYPPQVTQARVDSWNTDLDPAEVQRWAEASATAEVWNCPTQVALEHAAEDLPELRGTAAYQALSVGFRNLLEQPNTRPFAEPARSIQNQRRMIKALADAGAPLLIGTDAGIRFALPGYSIHEELQIFTDAGVSPSVALRSATLEYARFLRVDDRQGSVRPGYQADLVLVSGNPDEAVSVLLEQRQGVMIRGQWLSRETIDERLAEWADQN